MRILLIAYEFPPIIAAQSLRWFYLANELAKLGVEVHVLCPQMAGLSPFPVDFEDNVIIHRVWPGPYVGLAQAISAKSTSRNISHKSQAASGKNGLVMIYRVARKILNQVLYPDLRTEWYPFAKKRLKTIFHLYTFDAVISSHEPGVDVLLGLWVRKIFRIPLVVDLADPFLAPYSPRWRRIIDYRFERRVLEKADHVVVTTDRVIDLLCSRHGQKFKNKLTSVPQGYSTDISVGHCDDNVSKNLLNIVFTGTFYKDFRNPSLFANALRLLNSEKIQLIIAGANEIFHDTFSGIKNVKFIGKVDHFSCLDLQRKADVVLNIGNVQSYQLPGKIFEYLGSGSTILHIQTGSDDAGADLVTECGAGIVVKNDETEIYNALSNILTAWGKRKLDTLLDRNNSLIMQHNWSRRAQIFNEVLANNKDCKIVK